MQEFNLRNMITEYKIPFQHQEVINDKVIRIEVDRNACIGFTAWSYRIMYIKSSGVSVKSYVIYEEKYTDRWG